MVKAKFAMRTRQYQNRTRFLLATAAAAVLLASCGGDSAVSPVNSAPVTFSEMRVEDIAATRAVVRFQTSRPTSCEAEFGVAADALDRSARDPDMGAGFSVDHEVAIEDLTPETLYYYRARAVDPDGESYRSDIFQFTTAAAAPSTEDLTNVALASAGATVSDVSSNFGGASDDAQWGAESAFDDRMSTEWATDGDGDDAAITIDFGSQRTLFRFEFRSRQMADGSSIITSVRLIFDDGLILGPFDTSDPSQVHSFDFDEPVTARTVRVEAVASTGGNTGAREIRFFAIDDE